MTAEIIPRMTHRKVMRIDLRSFFGWMGWGGRAVLSCDCGGCGCSGARGWAGGGWAETVTEAVLCSKTTLGAGSGSGAAALLERIGSRAAAARAAAMPAKGTLTETRDFSFRNGSA